MKHGKPAKMPKTGIKPKSKTSVVGREMYGSGAPSMMKNKMAREHMRYSGR